MPFPTPAPMVESGEEDSPDSEYDLEENPESWLPDNPPIPTSFSGSENLLAIQQWDGWC